MSEDDLTSFPAAVRSDGVELLRGWQLPVLHSLAEWTETGRLLGCAERSVAWLIGEWWAAGERYGQRVAIVTAPDWDGPSHQTCRNAASVAARFDASRRRDTLSFRHHAEVAALPVEKADALLDWCEAPRRADPAAEPRSTLELRARMKSVRRAEREVQLAESTVAASASLGRRLYGVILVDPPWRVEPWSRQTGMDRAADNHYPTMPLDEIKALTIPAADDCVLFLWTPVPMVANAIDVVCNWGFSYSSLWTWEKMVAAGDKPRPGTGRWLRNITEHIIIATRGRVPCPAPGENPPSLIAAPVGRHSVKPDEFMLWIERIFPNVPKLEMFARRPRAGWDTWGNEVSPRRPSP